MIGNYEMSENEKGCRPVGQAVASDLSSPMQSNADQCQLGEHCGVHCSCVELSESY